MKDREILKLVSSYRKDDHDQERIIKGLKYLEMALKHLLGDIDRDTEHAIRKISSGGPILVLTTISEDDDIVKLEFTPIGAVQYLTVRLNKPHYEQDFR